MGKVRDEKGIKVETGKENHKGCVNWKSKLSDREVWTIEREKEGDRVVQERT